MNSSRAHAHLLLIEDDPALGAVTTEVLKHLGHEVDWKVSASEAFAALSQQHGFEVVVLDLGLGEDDGVALVRALRESGYVLPPILVLSAQPADALRHAVSVTGAVAVLQKPCSMGDLNAALLRTWRRERITAA